MTGGPLRRLNAVGNAEFFIDIVNVGLHGVKAGFAGDVYFHGRPRISGLTILVR